MDHAGLPLKTVLEQLDMLGEVAQELRVEFDKGRPANVPDAPTHAALVARAAEEAEKTENADAKVEEPAK